MADAELDREVPEPHPLALPCPDGYECPPDLTCFTRVEALLIMDELAEAERNAVRLAVLTRAPAAPEPPDEGLRPSWALVGVSGGVGVFVGAVLAVAAAVAF